MKKIKGFIHGDLSDLQDKPFIFFFFTIPYFSDSFFNY